MRLISTTTLTTVICGMLLTPGTAPAAASKEMQDLQRDVAQLQDQLTSLQKSSDAKLAAIQTQLQQALDTANKTSSSVTTLNSSVTQTIQSELKAVRDQLSSVTGLSVKVDNTSNDVSDLRSSLSALVSVVNKEQQQLNDILNQVKLIQAPPAAPPPGVDASVPGTSAPPPSAGTLFKLAVDDQNGGKVELALSEYAEFLKLYPDDPNCNKAQLQIGEIHYGQAKFDQAVSDFDAVIEKYPESLDVTPGAYYMKGMALYRKDKRSTAAIATFRDVIRKFPRSPEAGQAATQLRSMGVTATTPPARGKK